MSSEIVFFSSSSRSMRSMMAFSWSLAKRVACSSSLVAAAVAIPKTPENQPDKAARDQRCSRIERRHSNFASVGSRRHRAHPQRAHRSCAGGAPTRARGVTTGKSLMRESVAGMGLLHRRQLLGAGATLMFRLPGLVGHAVDGFAALVLGERHALLVGGVLQPVGQAVAAEAREI